MRHNNEAAPSWALSWGCWWAWAPPLPWRCTSSKIPVPFLTMDGDKAASPRMPQADWNPNTALGGKVHASTGRARGGQARRGRPHRNPCRPGHSVE